MASNGKANGTGLRRISEAGPMSAEDAKEGLDLDKDSSVQTRMVRRRGRLRRLWRRALRRGGHKTR